MTALMNRRETLTLLAIGAAALTLPSAAFAQGVHEIQMLNRHPEDKKRPMVFYPNIQVISAGDTVHFKATTKGHNSVSIKGMWPEGAKPWKSRFNKDHEVTLDVPGFYGYVCTPHAQMGMIGLIIVDGDGQFDNLEAARTVKHRGRLQKHWNALWERAEADGLLTPKPVDADPAEPEVATDAS